MQNVCKVIENLCSKYENAVMWVTGDFNLPNIDWSSNSVVGSTYPLELCNMLIDTFGFTQMVDSPTRGNNILDLFATNRPGLIQKVEVTPGLSDHEVIHITIESSLAATIIKPRPRTVFLWHQVDLQSRN